MQHDSEDVFRRIDREQGAYLEELKEFLRIPSVSTEPEHKDDVLRCAELLARQDARGGSDGRDDRDRRQPAGLRRVDGAPGKPTILFYGHYDVQPPDPLEEWRNPPFEPTVEGRRAGGARRHRRQGPVLHPRQGGGRHAGRARRAAGQRQVPDRGRRGGRRRGDREVRARRRRRQARLRRGGGLRHLDVRARPAVAALRPQGPLLHGAPGHRPEPRPALGLPLAAASPTRATPSCRIIGQLVDPRPAAGPGARASTTRSRRSRSGSARSSPPCRSTSRQYKADLASSRAVRRAWLHHPRARLGAADLRRQRPVERLPGRRRQDRPAGQGRRQGLHAAGPRPGSAGDRRALLRTTCSPGGAAGRRRWRSSICHGAGPVLVDIQGPSPSAAIAGQDEIWGSGRCGCARAAPSPSSRPSPTSCRCPILLLGFGLPDDRLHSPNEKFNVEPLLRRHPRRRALPRPSRRPGPGLIVASRRPSSRPGSGPPCLHSCHLVEGSWRGICRNRSRAKNPSNAS